MRLGTRWILTLQREPCCSKITAARPRAPPSTQAKVARSFRFLAEAPTTTLQRLKCLMTGGLPSFFDIGNSFSAGPLDEDNLVDQAVAAGKRVVGWQGHWDVPLWWRVGLALGCDKLLCIPTASESEHTEAPPRPLLVSGPVTVSVLTRMSVHVMAMGCCPSAA